MKTLDIIQGFCDHVFRDKKGNRIFPNIFVGKWEAVLIFALPCVYKDFMNLWKEK